MANSDDEFQLDTLHSSLFLKSVYSSIVQERRGFTVDKFFSKRLVSLPSIRKYLHVFSHGKFYFLINSSDGVTSDTQSLFLSKS